MTIVIAVGFFAVTMALSGIYFALRRIIVEQQFANHLMHTETVRRRQLNEFTQRSRELLKSYDEKHNWPNKAKNQTSTKDSPDYNQ